MSNVREKPIIHGRDHAHGGPDPTWTAYEDVGGPGSGGGGGSAVFVLPGHRLGATEDRWYPAAGLITGAVGLNLSAIGLFAWPFIPSRDMTLDRISVSVGSGGEISGSSIRIGIYDDDGNLYPDELLYDSGSVSTATSGEKTQTISQALTAGTLCWLAVHFSHGSVQCRSVPVLSSVGILGYGTIGLGMEQGIGWSHLSAPIAALPDPFTAGASVQLRSSAVYPCVWVRGT